MRSSLVPLLLLSLPTIAAAQCPDATQSPPVPAYIRIVGTNGGGPDPSGTFKITVKNSGGGPCIGTWVTIDFSQCTDVRLATAQPPGVTPLPLNNSVRAMTTAPDGEATFTILGAAAPDLGCNLPGQGAGCAIVCAEGVPLGTSTAVVYDLNGAAAGGEGINGADLFYAQNDFYCTALAHTYRGRSDFDMNGINTPGDASVYAINVIGAAVRGIGSRSGCFGIVLCKPPAGFTVFPSPTCP